MASAVAGLREAALSGSAPQMTAELLALFEQVTVQADKLQWVQAALAADLAVREAVDPALARACAAVAALVDARPATFDRHGYHNRQHFCEVALTAYGLCVMDELDARSTQLVVLAALIHDVVHEGRPQPAFVQERASVESMRPWLEAAGLDAAQMEQLMVLVLATDPSRGNVFLSALGSGNGASPEVPAEAQELAALAADAGLARLARLVCEADVLPSVGLGADHALRSQQRLAVEWRRPLDLADKLGFIDLVLRQGCVGAAFLPCVHVTRADLSAEMHAPVLG